MEESAHPALEHGPAEDLAAASLSLARRFAAGATLWCVAPQWPAHGRHVAVEFVHPVIVGTRALPAVNIDPADAVGSLRLLARPGDVVLAISPADDARIIDLLSRAPAWGLTSLWLGAGARPMANHANHVIWLEGTDPSSSVYSGDIVLLYHLLWELTHVVFEHPGLLEQEEPCTDEVCITCSDEGLVAEVRAVGPDSSVEALVGGDTVTVDASLVGSVQPGDLVLVHAGVAISMLGVDRS